MMTKKEIFELINKGIIAEHGHPVGVDDMIIDSQLDSLGMTLFFVELESIFPILEDVPDGDEFEALDIPNLTVKELINKCVLSIMPTDTESKTGETILQSPSSTEPDPLLLNSSN